MTDTPALKLAPAAPQTCAGMTVFPLVSLEPVELPYVLPEEAIAAGALNIAEVSDQGSVPTLVAANTGSVDILVLDGAQLIGAKQNRMASRSFILPAKSKTDIPVSCIEQGRWHFDRRTFLGAPQHSPSKTRKSVRDLEVRLSEGGQAFNASNLGAAQGAVWASVDQYSEEVGVRSVTSALDDVYDGARSRIDEWVSAFPSVEGQVGILIFREAEPLALDVVGGRALYARLHDRLLRGFALDALGRAGRRRSEPDAPAPGAPDESDALHFLSQVKQAKRSTSATVGKGDYRILSGPVVGAELTDADRLAHRSAFPA